MNQQRTHAENLPYLQRQFHTPAQQAASAKMGIWLFISQEILFFGGLFLAYGLLRYSYPLAHLDAHKYLCMPLGAIKTLLLLTVSLCIALALRAAQTDKQKQINWLLGFAISLALVFITLTAIEYASKIQAGLSPAALLNSGGAIMAAGLSDGSHLYIALFFTMTGIHALHLLVGIGLLLWIMTKTRQQIYNSSYYTPLENVGLFWHFMSVIWLFIFPLLYLTTAI